MSTMAVASPKCKIGFRSLPREIRDKIYKECLSYPYELKVMESRHMVTSMGWPEHKKHLYIHDAGICQMFGPFMPMSAPVNYINEARELFYSANTFVVPLRFIPDFLNYYIQDWRSRISEPPIKSFDHIRRLTVDVECELKSAETPPSWTLPELKRILEDLKTCPKLQFLELHIPDLARRAWVMLDWEKVADVRSVCDTVDPDGDGVRTAKDIAIDGRAVVSLNKLYPLESSQTFK